MLTRPAESSGFTILELMLVITLAALILGLGIPSLTQFIRNNQLTSAANDLLAAVHIARTEAIKRRLPTEMCFSQNPEAATPACNGNGTQGWVVWVDDADPAASHSNDGNGQIDANEPILLRHSAVPGSLTLVSKPGGNAGYITFMGTGFARAASDDIAGVVICDQRGNQIQYGSDTSTARGLLIGTTGRPAITRSHATIAADASLLDNGTCPP